ncbi:MAG: adenine deaminase [FCB group bacterium]|nr:adenine deaminase [FCB group bacterium]
MKYSGNIVDVVKNEIFPGSLFVEDGRISQVTRENRSYDKYILPGFVDAHIHIESSMLPPSEFARVCALHGTVAAVADPHEIANVLGMRGIQFMLESASKVPVKFYFSAPSCVPATDFETSGAELGVNQLDDLLGRNEIKYMGEMMNYPGVISDVPEILKKLALAKKHAKPIDGHAPGLSGQNLKKYISAGISTDHECFTREEALEKIRLGMKILIREGSAAKNLNTLLPIAKAYPGRCMFCSDDKHPDDLLKGHINQMVRMALNYGLDMLTVSQIATLNPVRHYGLDIGLLQTGDSADFLIVEDPKSLKITHTIIAGTPVALEGRPLLPHQPESQVNNFTAVEKSITDFEINASTGNNIRVIEVQDGQLITNETTLRPKVAEGRVISDTHRDILKLAVVNRYQEAPPAIAFVKNFGFKTGAIASSVAHDSHNIIAVGSNDGDLCEAVNLVIRHGGGVVLVDGRHSLKLVLPLPIAGLMSNLTYSETAQTYTRLDQAAKQLGTQLQAPFMTLSFLALLVIPELKLSDRGLFDSNRFQFVDLFTI